MKISHILGLLTVGLALASCSAGSASSSGWTTQALEAVSVKPKAGRDLKSVISPDAKYTLIVRDEGEHGDFVWYSLYLRENGKYTLIGSFNVIEKVVWAPDSSSVSFHGQRAIESNVMEEADYQYIPASKALRSRVIKKTALPD